MKVMKTFLVGLCSIIFCMNAQGQSFTLKGKLSGVSEPASVTLEFRGETMSQVTKDGTFEFKGNSMPTDAILKVLLYDPNLSLEDAAYWQKVAQNPGMWGAREVFLEGNITIEGKNISEATVAGSEYQKFYEDFRKRANAIESKLSKIQENEVQTDHEDDDSDDAPVVKRIETQEEIELKNQLNSLKLDFIEMHPNSYFSLDLAKKESILDDRVLARMVPLLGKGIQENSLYESLSVQVEGKKKVQIGSSAQLFTLPTADGKSISLEDYRGKYVLIDFWASWCVPCRAENPNLLAAFEQFKDKNFDILGISTDRSDEAWLRAVKEDKLPWSQVIDKQGDNVAVSTTYAINAIPQNFLIDPQGVIVAKDLRGKELQKKLQEILK